MNPSLRSLFIIIVLAISFSGCTEEKKQVEEAPQEARVKFEEGSLEDLNYRIGVEPGNSSNYYKRAQLFSDMSQAELALNDMKVALSLDSTNRAYHIFASDLFSNAREFDKAKSVIAAYLNQFPKDAEALVKMGEIWAYEKKTDSAFFFINRGLRVDKTFAKAYYLKGLIYKDLGNFDRTISSLQTAIEQDPKYTDAYLELGLTFIQKGDTSLGLQYLDNAVSSDPEKIISRIIRGRIYQEVDSFELAINDFEYSQNHGEKSASVSYRLGALYLIQEQYQNAATWFESAHTIEPNYFQALSAHAYVLELLNNNAAAKMYYTKALRINPEYDLAREGLAKLNITN